MMLDFAVAAVASGAVLLGYAIGFWQGWTFGRKAGEIAAWAEATDKLREDR
jgi:membrane protein DedA with SNARE-associated domain